MQRILLSILLVLSAGVIFGFSYSHNAYATGGTISDSSSCTAIGGTWSNPNNCSIGSITINNGETLTISSGVQLGISSITNQGTVDNSGYLQSTNFYNYGTLNNHGTRVSGGYSQFTNYAGSVLSNDGTFIFGGSEAFVNQGTVVNLPAGIMNQNYANRNINNYNTFTNDGLVNLGYSNLYNQIGGVLVNNGKIIENGQYNAFYNSGGNFTNNGNFTVINGFANFNNGNFTNNGFLIAANQGSRYVNGITVNGGNFVNDVNGLIINDVQLKNQLGASLSNNGIIRNECGSTYVGNEPTPNPTVHVVCPTATISAHGGTTGSPVSLTANVVGGIPQFTYSWNFILPPSGSQATFSNPNSATTSFTPDLPGNYWIGVTITDSEFARQTIGAQITIPVTAAPLDTTPPVVTVPAPITTSATGPSGAVVTFTTSATDPDDTAGPVQCNPASGSTFPIGTTTVTCTSTDTHSNTGSAQFTVTVTQITTTTTLASSQNPSTFGQSVTITAAVSPNTATGTVTFTVDGTPQTPVTVSSGQATFSSSSLSVGSHSITAAYSGDTNDAGSTSSTLTQVVNPISFSSFTAKVHIEDNYTHFELKSKFTLGTGSSGINPVTDNVSLQVGTFSTTVPSGSFKHDDKQYKFEGVINGVHIETSIKSLGSNTFELKAEAEHANMTGTANPVSVQVTIGNNSGTATVNAKIDVDHDTKHDNNSGHDHNTEHDNK
ncbi:MAG: Ig-like domain repeat protein [Nitrosotalea sp.]